MLVIRHRSTRARDLIGSRLDFDVGDGAGAPRSVKLDYGTRYGCASPVLLRELSTVDEHGIWPTDAEEGAIQRAKLGVIMA